MTRLPGKKTELENLLVEIGCEELPPKALDGIRDAFFDAVRNGLESNNLTFNPDASRAYSSPRRLAVCFSEVAPRQPDQVSERRGPAVSAAFDSQGRPTAAALGFAKSAGKDVSDLQTIRTEKGEWLCNRAHDPGKSLAELIFPLLEQAIKQLPVQRPMRWADHDFSFIRPVHWLVVMYGERVLEGCLLGQRAADLTWGHRIHSPGPHKIPHSSDYEDILGAAFVLADPEYRKKRIRESLLKSEPEVSIDPGLLNEVNNLVEWPVPVLCSFEEEFLEVPHAALIASMQDHQKFFPVRDPDDPEKVTNQFIAISNIESTHEPSVKEGYERVIRPRLADARFFLEQDKKQSLEAYLPLLDHVVFQKNIGSIGDRSRRMSAISAKIADDLSLNSDPVSRAAELAKCDLMTQMVGEFPELQGVMGQYYASASGESEEISVAIGEHYAPRFAGDTVPSSLAGQIVSISDRLDSLVGIFAAGLRPSGNKDPFALRRAALGLVRILIEAEIDLSLNRLIAIASNEFREGVEVAPELLLDVREFVAERLRNYYRDQSFGAELINAVLVSGWETLPDFDRRLRALANFMGLEDAIELAAANKRIGNILRKAEGSYSTTINTDLLILEEERRLFDEVMTLETKVTPLLEQGDYESALKHLARLRKAVDAFFDSVMVMDEDRRLRINRLSLLARMKSLFDRVADLSVLG